MPYLETEEEAAENIADINEQKDVRKKDNKARTFAPSDNTEEVAKNIADINEIDLREVDNLISDINDYSHNNNKVKISEGAYIYFSDFVKFLNDIKNGKINNSNIKKAYEDNIRDIEIKLLSTKRESNNINKYNFF